MISEPGPFRRLTPEPVLELACTGSPGLPSVQPIDIEEQFARTLDELVEGFSEQAAILDENWTIMVVNKSWKEMVTGAGYPELVPGAGYRSFLKAFALKGHVYAKAILAGLDEIDQGRSNSFQLTYAGVEKLAGHTLQVRINRVHIDGRALATIARHDITDTTELRRLREEFSSSLMEGQAEERRRLARELHDSTAQLLTSVGLLLATLKRKSRSRQSLGVMEEVQGLLSEAQQEIRSISSLARPPALDKMSLADALDVLIGGFGRRTGLHASFEVSGDAVRLPETIEGALYRVAQEALSNAHRHAHGRHVRTQLCFGKSMVHLVVTDDGTGISKQSLAGRTVAGVGISGMRSRLLEIGGRLSLRRLLPGTAVIASVPYRN